MNMKINIFNEFVYIYVCGEPYIYVYYYYYAVRIYCTELIGSYIST